MHQDKSVNLFKGGHLYGNIQIYYSKIYKNLNFQTVKLKSFYHSRLTFTHNQDPKFLMAVAKPSSLILPP